MAPPNFPQGPGGSSPFASRVQKPEAAPAEKTSSFSPKLILIIAGVSSAVAALIVVVLFVVLNRDEEQPNRAATTQPAQTTPAPTRVPITPPQGTTPTTSTQPTPPANTPAVTVNPSGNTRVPLDTPPAQGNRVPAQGTSTPTGTANTPAPAPAPAPAYTQPSKPNQRPVPQLVRGGTGPFGLVNQQMTEGGALPLGWDQFWLASGAAQARRDTLDYRSAPSSLWVGSTAGPGEGQVSQHLAMTSSQRFAVSGWVRTAGTARVTFGVQFYDAASKPIQFSEVLFTEKPQRWTQSRLSVEPPPQARSFAIVLNVAGTGQAWLDDVMIERD